MASPGNFLHLVGREFGAGNETVQRKSTGSINSATGVPRKDEGGRELEDEPVFIVIVCSHPIQLDCLFVACHIALLSLPRRWIEPQPQRKNSAV